MNRRSFLLLIGVAPSLAAAADYAEGDVWSFKARANEPKAKVAIVHIERNTSEGDVYFVYFLDVKLELKGPPGPASVYGSVAVTKACLDASVIQKVGSGANYPYRSGYAMWKESLEKYKVGAYRKPLVEVQEHLERTVFITKW